MNTTLFRKSSIDRVNSPEQLNAYIRVATPGVWLVLSAVVILLVGVVIWGFFGTVDTKIETGVIVDGGTATCYVAGRDALSLKAGLAVSANSVDGVVRSVATVPIQIDESFPSYLLYLTGFGMGDFCYSAEVELPGLKDGVYAAEITVDSTHPISFVIH